MSAAAGAGGAGGGFPDALFTITGDPGAITASAKKFGDYAAAAFDLAARITATRIGSWTGTEGDLFRSRAASYTPMMRTAGEVFADVDRTATAFADTMHRQQTAMKALRDEAWAVWQQLQAARAAQSAAAVDLDAATAAAATLPVTANPVTAAATATRLADAGQAASAADARVGALEAAWQNCLERAQRIHDLMNDAAEQATNRIAGLRGPDSTPAAAPGGATGTTMPNPVTPTTAPQDLGASSGGDGAGFGPAAAPFPLTGTAATAVTPPTGILHVPWGSVPVPAGNLPLLAGWAQRTVDGFVDKLRDSKEWKKGINTLPSDKLVDHSDPWRLDLPTAVGRTLQASGFATQFAPLLGVRIDLVDVAKGKGNALPAWSFLPKSWLAADSARQQARLLRLADGPAAAIAGARRILPRAALVIALQNPAGSWGRLDGPLWKAMNKGADLSAKAINVATPIGKRLAALPSALAAAKPEKFWGTASKLGGRLNWITGGVTGFAEQLKNDFRRRLRLVAPRRKGGDTRRTGRGRRRPGRSGRGRSGGERRSRRRDRHRRSRRRHPRSHGGRCGRRCRPRAGVMTGERIMPSVDPTTGSSAIVPHVRGPVVPR